MDFKRYADSALLSVLRKVIASFLFYRALRSFQVHRAVYGDAADFKLFMDNVLLSITRKVFVETKLTTSCGYATSASANQLQDTIIFFPFLLNVLTSSVFVTSRFQFPSYIVFDF